MTAIQLYHGGADNFDRVLYSVEESLNVCSIYYFQHYFRNNEKEKVSKRIRTVYPEYNDDEVQKMVESDKVEGNLFSKGYLQETEKAKRQLTELEGELEYWILRCKHQDSFTKEIWR